MNHVRRALLSMPVLGWILWFLGIGAVAAWLGGQAFGSDPRFFLPGPSTPGHHQIEQNCAACHDSTGKVDEDRCLGCHREELKEARDSHPKSKFTDPRNADRLEGLDAMRCVTCHREHRPDHTHPMGVSLPEDYCQHCHADIGAERETHQDLPFSGCAAAGCHNYHDNKVLHEDFLAKHIDAPAHLPKAQARVPERDALIRWIQHEGKPPPVDAPPTHSQEQATADWHASLHAKAGVSCLDCHAKDAKGQDTDWVERPRHDRCSRCHETQVAGWLDGKHGMAWHAGAAMTVGRARLPMTAAAAHRELDCSSCHGAHRYDTVHAQVDACLQCHSDQHSQAYVGTPHHRAWAQDPATGVSCATCHLPRRERMIDGVKRVVVEHDQNAFLRPVETMAQAACMQCHGLPYSLDALADPAAIRSNFAQPPSVHVPGIDWVRERVHAHDAATSTKESP